MTSDRNSTSPFDYCYSKSDVVEAYKGRLVGCSRAGKECFYTWNSKGLLISQAVTPILNSSEDDQARLSALMRCGISSSAWWGRLYRIECFNPLDGGLKHSLPSSSYFDPRVLTNLQNTYARGFSWANKVLLPLASTRMSVILPLSSTARICPSSSSTLCVKFFDDTSSVTILGRGACIACYAHKNWATASLEALGTVRMRLSIPLTGCLS